MSTAYPYYLHHIRLVNPVKVGKPKHESPSATSDLECQRDAQDRLLVIERTSEHTVTLYRQCLVDGKPAPSYDRLQELSWQAIAEAERLDKTPIPAEAFTAGLPAIPTRAERMAAAQKAEQDAVRAAVDKQAAEQAAERDAIAASVEAAKQARKDADAAALARQEAQAAALAKPPGKGKG